MGTTMSSINAPEQQHESYAVPEEETRTPQSVKQVAGFEPRDAILRRLTPVRVPRMATPEPVAVDTGVADTGAVEEGGDAEFTRQEAVSQLAYSLWEANGRPEGTDIEDWLNAERQIEAGEPPAHARKS